VTELAPAIFPYEPVARSAREDLDRFLRGHFRPQKPRLFQPLRPA
jgi:hypothetical protein